MAKGLSLGRLRTRYEGPEEFRTTERSPSRMCYRLVCPFGLPAGTEVRVSLSKFRSFCALPWSLEGVEVCDASGRVVDDGGVGRVVLAHVIPRGWDQMMRGGDTPAGGGMMGRNRGPVHLCTIVVTQSMTRGSQLGFNFNGVLALHAIDGQLEMRVRPQHGEAFELVGKPVALRNLPGPPARLEVRAAQPDAHGQVRLGFLVTDEYANPVTDYAGRLLLDGEGAQELPPEIQVTAADAGCAVLEIGIRDEELPLRIHGRDDERDLEATSAAIAVRQDGHGLYSGGIHFHTDFSIDGDRQLERAYEYARDYLNLDVIAATDHAPLGADWEETLRINEDFNESGRFVTIPAWESSNAFGHANVYLRSPDSSGHPGLWRPDRSPSDNPWPQDVVVVPHHTAVGKVMAKDSYWEHQSSGRYWGAYDWSVPNERVRLVEMVQTRGSMETNTRDRYWGVQNEGSGASVRDALTRGYRLGFVAGTDNHQGFSTQIEGDYIGLTAFLAPELSRDAIWCAMDQRRTYATSGVPIVCHFEVNGELMGGECSIPRGETVCFSATLHGTAPIELIEVISNGITVWQTKPHKWDVELADVELTRQAHASTYYYLRLRQADGHRAWLSPVWVDIAGDHR